MNKKQSLEILERAKKRIINMTEQEKRQMSKRIDDFCSNRKDDIFYEHSRFEIEFEKNQKNIQKSYSTKKCFTYNTDKKIGYKIDEIKVA